jgi:hypothetical protein
MRAFTLTEARALHGKYLLAIQNLTDDQNHIIIPRDHSVQVIGVHGGTLGAYEIAVQYGGQPGLYPPKVVLMNKTTYEKHFILA